MNFPGKKPQVEKEALVAEEYLSSLSDLKELSHYSESYIKMLTIIAEENIEFAAAIVKVVESHILKVQAEAKLPILYLIDAIVKNVKGPYVQLFNKCIVNIFCGVFEKVNKEVRKLMYALRKTWNKVLSPQKLYALDVKVKNIDRKWPITAKMVKTRDLLKLREHRLEIELEATKNELEENERQLTKTRLAIGAASVVPVGGMKPAQQIMAAGEILRSGLVADHLIEPVIPAMVNTMCNQDPRVAGQLLQYVQIGHGGMGGSSSTRTEDYNTDKRSKSSLLNNRSSKSSSSSIGVPGSDSGIKSSSSSSSCNTTSASAASYTSSSQCDNDAFEIASLSIAFKRKSTSPPISPNKSRDAKRLMNSRNYGSNSSSNDFKNSSQSRSRSPIAVADIDSIKGVDLLTILTDGGYKDLNQRESGSGDKSSVAIEDDDDDDVIFVLNEENSVIEIVDDDDDEVYGPSNGTSEKELSEGKATSQMSVMNMKVKEETKEEEGEDDGFEFVGILHDIPDEEISNQSSEETETHTTASDNTESSEASVTAATTTTTTTTTDYHKNISIDGNNELVDEHYFSATGHAPAVPLARLGRKIKINISKNIVSTKNTSSSSTTTTTTTSATTSTASTSNSLNCNYIPVLCGGVTTRTIGGTAARHPTAPTEEQISYELKPSLQKASLKKRQKVKCGVEASGLCSIM